MKLKTSVTIISCCLFIFLFIMLPIFLSIENKKDEYVASLKGSKFSLQDVNDNIITENSFESSNPKIYLKSIKSESFNNFNWLAIS